MRYLVDACAMSETVKPKRDPGLVQWFAEVHENDLCMSVLTVAELEKGILKLPASRKKERLLRWVQDDVKERFADRLLDVDLDVAVTWARIRAEAERKGSPPPVIDSLVAATAVAHDCAVVTRNIVHIERCGARVVNPWSKPR